MPFKSFRLVAAASIALCAVTPSAWSQGLPLAPNPNTTHECPVLAKVGDSGFLVRCADVFTGVIVADHTKSGYYGYVICRFYSDIPCAEAVPITMANTAEAPKPGKTITCLATGTYATDNFKFTCTL